MKKITLPIILCLVLILQACGSKKDMLYLQDLDNYSNSKVSYVSPNIQPNDILKVEVSDLNPLVAAPFNINSGSSGQGSVEMMKLSGYLVNPQGNITLPILNEIMVGGITPAQAEVKIKGVLINDGYLVNPTVQVRVLNNKFTILGEVKSPGVIPFTEESISLIDAIGMAGDLTYSGVRKDVILIRELDGKRFIYHVDLTTASWMSNSDYRIRQNDVIMVNPNKYKSNSGRVVKDPLQLISILATVVTLILLIK